MTPFVIFCNNLFSLFGQITFFFSFKTFCSSPACSTGCPLQSVPICLAASFISFLPFLSGYFIYLGLFLLGFFVLLFSLDFKIASVARAFLSSFLSCCWVQCSAYIRHSVHKFDDWLYLEFSLFLIGWAREFLFWQIAHAQKTLKGNDFFFSKPRNFRSILLKFLRISESIWLSHNWEYCSFQTSVANLVSVQPNCDLIKLQKW